MKRDCRISRTTSGTTSPPAFSGRPPTLIINQDRSVTFFRPRRIAQPSQNNQLTTLTALIYHAGGLIAGSADIVSPAQISHLCAHGFVAVLPNYRLVPHVSGRTAFQDAEDAFDWTVGSLPALLQQSHALDLDVANVVALGHSSGGTMVLHLASLRKPIRAVMALYPFLFVADTSTNAHGPATGGLFDTMPEFEITQADWAEIKPEGVQLSEAPLPVGGTPTARNKWLMNILRNGEWLKTLQPDGDFAAIDPFTRLHAEFAPTFLIHGSEDNVPGRSEELVRRAGNELRGAGAKDVEVRILQGAGHLFDHFPEMSPEQWDAVVRGLDWLVEHAKSGDEEK